MELFDFLFFKPFVNILIFFYRVLEASNIPGALGFSIILLTVVIRLIVWPLITSQLKSAKKMADLKPHMDELKVRHKDDKQELAKAQMALYKEHGVSPAGGCLPLLLQLPVFFALVNVINAIFNGQSGLEQINKALYFPAWHLTALPDPNFFGFNLTLKPGDLINFANPLSFFAIPLTVLAVPVITVILSFIQSKMMIPSPVKKYPSDSKKEVKEKESTEDAMVAMQSQMTYLMPLMFGIFAFQFPIGLSLYWNVYTVLGIYHQHRISGWGGMVGLVQSVKGKVQSRIEI